MFDSMKAFIVRPFGTKSGIDFEGVQKYLIAPALAALDIQGSTTEPFLQAGNIRADMFQQLLVADIVIADISIHNANVFYELGIRHALQPNRTFLLRAKSMKDPRDRGSEDEIPFDLRTDRYLEYDSQQPGGKLELFTDALRQTLASDYRDSPVFQMLPNLEGQDRSRFLPVPQTFSDDVEIASKARQLGLLGLLAMEAKDFFWASEGLRLVGRAQFNLKAYREAKATWQELYKLNPSEPEANQRLGTIYQRLGDLDASDQALQRVLSSKAVTGPERAEALSLIGRNIKDRWRSSWRGMTGERAESVALDSPDLLKAYEKYRQGFQANLDSFYSGLNALSLLTVSIELAKKLPEVWGNRFDTTQQASAELDAFEVQRQKLTGAVGVSLDASKEALQRSGTEDLWVNISVADYLFLTSSRPSRVAFAYQEALTGAPDFAFDSARAQLEIFESLGILTEKTTAAMAVFQAPGTRQEPKLPPARVILFTGHMIDAPGANPPRFPDSARGKAEEKIRIALQQEIARTEGAVVAIASGASGGDLLFHEICEELKIEHRLCLPLPPDNFRNESVSPAGRLWEDKFDALLRKYPSPPCLACSNELPLWISVKKGYTSWQRANLWLINEALAINARNFTLLALWDGVKTEGIGGTYHMRTLAQQYGAALVTIFTRDLFNADSATTQAGG
jgi:tetratricopeptide (TPR) repeat protein